MPKAIDETGSRYGMLTVVRRVYPERHRLSTYWLCKCDCGGAIVASGGSLRSGGTTSCGCKGRGTRKNKWNKRLAEEIVRGEEGE